MPDMTFTFTKTANELSEIGRLAALALSKRRRQIVPQPATPAQLEAMLRPEIVELVRALVRQGILIEQMALRDDALAMTDGLGL